MLTLIGLLTIFCLVVMLLSGRMSPVLPLIVVPLLGALCAGFGADEISGFFTDGVGKVVSIATMFIFAITFFGVLQDTGLFRPIIGFLVKLTRGNVIAVLRSMGAGRKVDLGAVTGANSGYRDPEKVRFIPIVFMATARCSV